MPLPRLRNPDAPNADDTDAVTLVVYAPFGSDPVLSTFPDGSSVELAQHPLMKSLARVAECGVHVVALVDRVGTDTYLVEMPAHHAAAPKISSRWKLDMDAPATLTGLLRHAHLAHPNSALVLAMEGHGAGFLPDIDTTTLTSANVTGAGLAEWRIGTDLTRPLRADGSALLTTGAPVLPRPSPTCPTNHPAMSTYGLGHALKVAQEGGVPQLAVIHFNNCFNMAVEVLHTVAPSAQYATGYENYNFFTSGEAYPAVFHRLRTHGVASPAELATWFAEANDAMLRAKGHHPTVGCAVHLARLHTVVKRIDDLSDALLSALRSAGTAERALYVERIKQAIIRAQNFDTDGDMVPEAPDELTDICSLAHELQVDDFGPHPVHATAAALEQALADIKVYGDRAAPWTAPGQIWDFTRPELAMNIFLPDPLRIGRWDWRSPYYLDVNPDPAHPPTQAHIIEFVKVTDWVDFIVEYHKDAPFDGLLPAQNPAFPHFNPHYQPPPQPPKGGGRGDDRCSAEPKRTR